MNTPADKAAVLEKLDAEQRNAEAADLARRDPTPTLHLHAPKSTRRVASRDECPCCRRRSVVLSWFTPWYGWNSTCLRCGDMWADGQRLPRPFMKGWRKFNADTARRQWRREGTALQYAMAVAKLPCDICDGMNGLHSHDCPRKVVTDICAVINKSEGA